jgi:hypothetical protein
VQREVANDDEVYHRQSCDAHGEHTQNKRHFVRAGRTCYLTGRLAGRALVDDDVSVSS